MPVASTAPRRSRRAVAVAALLAVTAACEREQASPGAGTTSAAPAAPATTASSVATASRPAPWWRAPDGGAAPEAVRLDPLAHKLYLAELCHLGALGLRHFRDGYLASLGGAEPGPGRVPQLDAGGRADYERMGHDCARATKAREPALPAVDEALASLTPAALELAQSYVLGSGYYRGAQPARDGFARGRLLHGRIAAASARLDELGDALGAAMERHRREHAPDLAALAPGERLAQTARDAVRALVLSLASARPSAPGSGTLLARAEAALGPLAAWAAEHPDDPWSRTAASCRAALEAARAARPATGSGRAGGPTLLAAVVSLTTAVDAHHHAAAAARLGRGGG
ncbi:MAG: hypothetical protein HY744_09530 [Deltaproteobacteria bacterium]|nr:hypothetical protein [Deltaproteobacteria bacterium]